MVEVISDKAADNVNHPKHYADTTCFECIEVIEMTLGYSGAMAFCQGNAIKYLWRYRNKNGVEDLNKCQWYLDRYVDLYVKCVENQNPFGDEFYQQISDKLNNAKKEMGL